MPIIYRELENSDISRSGATMASYNVFTMPSMSPNRDAEIHKKANSLNWLNLVCPQEATDWHGDSPGVDRSGGWINKQLQIGLGLRVHGHRRQRYLQPTH